MSNVLLTSDNWVMKFKKVLNFIITLKGTAKKPKDTIITCVKTTY